MKVQPGKAIIPSVIVGWLSFFVILWITVSINSTNTCVDGWGSVSIGEMGACSHHGGVKGSFLPIVSIPLSVLIGWGVFKWLTGPTKRPKSSFQIASSMTPSDRLAAVSTQMPKVSRNSVSPGEIRCPQCNSPMKERTAKYGRHAGMKFLGCTRYPECHGLRSLAEQDV